MDARPGPLRLTFPDDSPDARDMAALLRRNIEAMRAQRARDEAQASWGEKLAARITDFTGSLPFVWVHAVLVAGWVAANLGLIPGVPRFDRSFVILATVASVEAIFLSTFVLISQNRIAAIADKRADLDLQINLLAEYEITQLVKLTTKIAERLHVEGARDPQLEQIAEEVAPEAVLEELDAEADRPRRRHDRDDARPFD
ncbi:MAG: hypothetical protein JWQ97_3982 [Phenylobacterium sp.]|nr:hypothetical protein [Phenylobacterium sp.]